MKKATGFGGNVEETTKEGMTNALCIFDDSNETLVLTEDCYTLDVQNVATIQAAIPIEASTVETVVINGPGTLCLKATEFMQPCIGSKTYTGMSYGRWTAHKCKCKKIVVNGARVVCESTTPNFTIGAYNFEEYPKVICINGGEMICPETDAKRILKIKAYPPYGSTKISTIAEYVLEGQELFSEGQKKLIEEIAALAPAWKMHIDYRATSKFLETALELLKMNPNCNVNMLVNGRYQRYAMICRTMCVLGMPERLYNDAELLFESNKLEFLEKEFKFPVTSKEDTALAVCELMHHVFGDDFSKLSDWQVEQVYEMIPTYFYEFEPGVPHMVDAERFFGLMNEVD